MKYDPNSFIALIDAVEVDGGAHLPEACKEPKYRLEITDASGTKRMKDYFATGCRKEHRLAIPYDPGEPTMLPDSSFLDSTVDQNDVAIEARVAQVHKALPVSSPVVPDGERAAQRNRGAGFATVCATDDNVGMWPRFQSALRDV